MAGWLIIKLEAFKFDSLKLSLAILLLKITILGVVFKVLRVHLLVASTDIFEVLRSKF